ncbi:Metalloendopeptidase, partial [Gryllus bimaculatus]
EAPLWTRSGQWQGDIVLSPEQKVAIRSGRTGLINTFYRWGDRTIPYKLKDGDFNEAQAAIIRNSLEEYNTRTCVRVREATAADRDWVLQQQLNLQDNQWGTCLISGTVVHEFLHAFGFYHQQSATERDDYVQILWDNIQD